MRSSWRVFGLLLLALTVGGQACAEKLRPRDDEVPIDDETDAAVSEEDPNGVTASGLPNRSGKFKNAEKSDGSILTQVDATEETDWQQFDLDTGSSSEDEHAWDLAFSRFKIRTNGGVSGPGGVYVAALEGQSFDELTKAPDEGFAADREDSEDDTDTDPDNVFNSGDEDWYEYDVMHHELSPKDITYVIASTEERFFKFRIDAYYDSAGTPAKLKIHWREIDAPDSGFPP